MDSSVLIDLLLPLHPDYDKPLPKESVCWMKAGTVSYSNNYTKKAGDLEYYSDLVRVVFPGKTCRMPQNVLFDRVLSVREDGTPI